MTVPPPYLATPPRVGVNPTTADEVNYSVGTLLREFVVLKEKVNHYQAWLVAIDLKEPPYEMPAETETLLKSAVFGLDGSLDAVDMTFINQLVGLW